MGAHAPDSLSQMGTAQPISTWIGCQADRAGAFHTCRRAAFWRRGGVLWRLRRLGFRRRFFLLEHVAVVDAHFLPVALTLLGRYRQYAGDEPEGAAVRHA